MADGANDRQRLTFGSTMRIRRSADFEAIYEVNVRQNAGPLLVYARPNGLPHPRLGLAVSRRVGNAVIRNQTKRRLREAFRRSQHELPSGYDFVISVRPHERMKTADYQQFLLAAARNLHEKWTRKLAQLDRRSQPGCSSDS